MRQHTTKAATMYRRITKHGHELITLFSLPTTTDPVQLCKKLRRIEQTLTREFTKACNEEHDTTRAEHNARINLTKILGPQAARIRFNHDPRGYALKIDMQPGERLYQDWGGYGIIAPDLTED